VFVFYGGASRFTASISLASADAVVLGEHSCGLSTGHRYGRFGYSLAGAGNLDVTPDDGSDVETDDLVIGAPYLQTCMLTDPPETCTCGSAEVGAAYWVPGGSYSGMVNASTLGVTFRPSDLYLRALMGWSVDAGDITGTEDELGVGDGRPDLVIGAPWYTIAGAARGGAFVFSGDQVASPPPSSSFTTPMAHLWLGGEDPYDYAGWSVATGGDLNQDGEPDILVGAFGSDRGGFLSGAAYVVLSSHD